jgi:hypothetical protein
MSAHRCHICGYVFDSEKRLDEHVPCPDPRTEVGAARDRERKRPGYVWISRTTYTVTDTAR